MGFLSFLTSDCHIGTSWMVVIKNCEFGSFDCLRQCFKNVPSCLISEQDNARQEKRGIDPQPTIFSQFFTCLFPITILSVHRQLLVWLKTFREGRKKNETFFFVHFLNWKSVIWITCMHDFEVNFVSMTKEREKRMLKNKNVLKWISVNAGAIFKGRVLDVQDRIYFFSR